MVRKWLGEIMRPGHWLALVIAFVAGVFLGPMVMGSLGGLGKG